MFKSEIYKIIKNKRSKFFIILVILIPIFDIVIHFFEAYMEYFTNLQGYPNGFPKHYIYEPNFATFLPGNSIGHIPQMLLLWILPIYVLLIYSDSYVREKQSGYNSIIFSKYSRKEIIRTKLLVSFVVFFTIVFIGLFINFILAQIVFKGGTWNPIEHLTDMNSVFELSKKWPLITNIVYIIMVSLIAGGCGILCTSLSFLIPNYKVLYPVAFLLWVFQIASKYSLMYVVQPFIEYGVDYIIPALITYNLCIIIVTIVAYIKKVKYDEI